MPTNTPNKRPTRVLNPAEWSKLRENLNDAYELVPTVGPTGDHGHKRVLKADAPAGVELTFGEAGVSTVDAMTGNILDRPSPGPRGGGMPPMLTSDIIRAATIARAQGWSLVLLSQAYVRALTRFSISTGIQEGPEGEARLAELADEAVEISALPNMYVLVQSQFQFNRTASREWTTSGPSRRTVSWTPSAPSAKAATRSLPRTTTMPLWISRRPSAPGVRSSAGPSAQRAVRRQRGHGDRRPRYPPTRSACVVLQVGRHHDAGRPHG